MKPGSMSKGRTWELLLFGGAAVVLVAGLLALSCATTTSGARQKSGDGEKATGSGEGGGGGGAAHDEGEYKSAPAPAPAPAPTPSEPEAATPPRKESPRATSEPPKNDRPAGPAEGGERKGGGRGRDDEMDALHDGATAKHGKAAPTTPKSKSEAGGKYRAPEKKSPRAEDVGASSGSADRPSRSGSPGVKAGSADDNMQFNAFLAFLEKNVHLALKWDVSQRVIVAVKDRDGLPLADAEVTVLDGGKELARRRTYADGRTLLFPSESKGIGVQSATVRVRHRGGSKTVSLGSGGHRLDIRIDHSRESYARVPVDLVFVLDTTGSMGDEIAQLKKTLEEINFQISNLSPAPEVRFGMVLFRDRGDEYVTRVVPLTSDLREFQRQLEPVRAGGGGDEPEDVQEALKATMTKLAWRREGAKLAFLIGDAAPHLNYGQTYTYVTAMREAAERGIKITTIGCSGLDTQGETVWRQVAQYTMAPFVFLTRGEKGDSEGSASSVSHHIGSNWVAENLDAIIIRMVKLELANYSPKGTVPTEDYFTASFDSRTRPDDVLTDLFHQAVKQLVDYSVQRIEGRTPTVILPIQPTKKGLAAAAKKLETRLSLGLSGVREFQLLESRDLSAVVRAQSAQLSEKYDSSQAIKLGKLLPAKLAILARIEEAGPKKVEMLVKLVRLESGEVLSLSLLKIERGLL
jgi:Mg-chelatase subunit ChlD